MRDLLQLAEGIANGVEIRQILGGGSLFAVLHDTVLIDDERGARTDGAKADEVGEQNTVSLGGFLIQIAGERDADLFLLRPGFLRERAIDAHADDFGVHAFVLAQTGGDVAHFSGTDAGEGEREENQDGVGFAEIVAELHIHQTAGLLGFERKIWSF